jgi:hypothetical protein
LAEANGFKYLEIFLIEKKDLWDVSPEDRFLGLSFLMPTLVKRL